MFRIESPCSALFSFVSIFESLYKGNVLPLNCIVFGRWIAFWILLPFLLQPICGMSFFRYRFYLLEVSKNGHSIMNIDSVLNLFQILTNYTNYYRSWYSAITYILHIHFWHFSSANEAIILLHLVLYLHYI